MSVIALDPGTKNLGACMIDSSGKIIRWECLNIDPSAKGIFDGLEKINFAEWIAESSDVVIERQPSKNPRAVRIQYFLEMYAASRGGRMYTIDPKHKLGWANATEWWPTRDITSWSYGERKKLSVETAVNYLKGTEQDSSIVDFFEKSKKKDDLADALLHALAFLHVIKPTIGEFRRPVSVRNIKPVRPSATQISSGKFTQGGLKFLAKGLLNSYEAFEIAIKDIHGFETAAIKHFETIENCYTQLGGR
jgi:hypothetical protein